MELRHSGSVAPIDLSDLTDEDLVTIICTVGIDVRAPMKTIRKT